MARSKSSLPGGSRVSDLVTLGVLTKYVTRDDIGAAIIEGGASGERERLLTPELTAFYVIALSLFRHVNYEEVLSLLLEGLRWLKLPNFGIATKSAISQARNRLGKDPMRLLFDRLAVPMSTPKTRGAWYRSWLTVAIDGTTLTLGDTTKNAETFGYPGEQAKASFPIMKCVCLVETGTHAAFAAALGPYATGEGELARELAGKLKPGMLVIADRNYLSFESWKVFSDTGADLVWRVTSRWGLKPIKTLADGSWLSKIQTPFGSPEKAETLLRVVRYQVKGSDETYRLVTTILDPELAPAHELAQLYHERWEIESVFDEMKTHLRGPRLQLRSKSPDLVEQEFWCLMIAHRAIRSIMHEAALSHQLDPDEISFTHTVNVVRRTLQTRVSFSPSGDPKTA